MKKGFVFMETLIVLVVLTVSVVTLYSMYIKISTDIEERKYYDNISDLYKTDILRELIDTSKLSNTEPLITITKDNCANYMSSDCTNIMTSLSTENIYINSVDLNALMISENILIKNSMREYLKILEHKKNTRYIIVNFNYNNKNYYASLII